MIHDYSSPGIPGTNSAHKPAGHLALILLVLMWGFSGCKNQPGEKEPNIILFLADDLGYNDLTCYRQDHPGASDMPPTAQTPHIDRLAEEGLRFTQFYCGAAVCSPSRSALLTGRNATRVGIYNWIPHQSPMHLRSQEVTLAELLKNKNYQTAHFGKWHLTSPGTDQPLPNDQGYDYSFFTYNNARPSHRNPHNFYRNGEPVGQLEGFACQLVVDEALQWLDQRSSPSEPYCINIWFNEPHEKVDAPDSLVRRHSYRKKYYGSIENMDLAVGRVLEYLENHPAERETVVIFSSDNGSQENGSNDPLRGEKAFNYEGGVRVPFIIRFPGVTRAGTLSETPGSFTDLLPTLAEITGIPLPEDRTIDGTSLVPVLTDRDTAVERNHPIVFYRYFHDPILMMRDGDWCLLGYQKPLPYAESYNEIELALIQPDSGEPRWSQWGFQSGHMEFIRNQEPACFELYNLRSDPSQRNDLSGEEPGRVERMKQQMMKLRNEMLEEGGDWFK